VGLTLLPHVGLRRRHGGCITHSSAASAPSSRPALLPVGLRRQACQHPQRLPPPRHQAQRRWGLCPTGASIAASCSPRRLPATWPRPRCAFVVPPSARRSVLAHAAQTRKSQRPRPHCCSEAQSLTAGIGSRCCSRQLALSLGAGVDSRPRRSDIQAHSLTARVDLRPWRLSRTWHSSVARVDLRPWRRWTQAPRAPPCLYAAAPLSSVLVAAPRRFSAELACSSLS